MKSPTRPEVPTAASVRVRPALPEDAPGIARIHWDAWHATYRGLLPDAGFDAFPLSAREALWHSTALVARLAPAQRQMLWVAVAADDDAATTAAAPHMDAAAPAAPLLGFACVGPLRSNHDVTAAVDRGELWALYLRPDVRRRGIGSALWRVAARWLRDDAGCAEMALWVLAENTAAIAFYRAQGCERIASGSFDARGVQVAQECWRIGLG